MATQFLNLVELLSLVFCGILAKGVNLQAFGNSFVAPSIAVAKDMSIREASLICVRAGLSCISVENDNAVVVPWCFEDIALIRHGNSVLF